jgi:hypothetical protein
MLSRSLTRPSASRYNARSSGGPLRIESSHRSAWPLAQLVEQRTDNAPAHRRIAAKANIRLRMLSERASAHGWSHNT